MKTIVISPICVVLMVVGGWFGYNNYFHSSADSALLLANVEALSQPEGGGGGQIVQTCYMAFSNRVAMVHYSVCSQYSSDPNYQYPCADITPFEPLGMSLISRCYWAVAG